MTLGVTGATGALGQLVARAPSERGAEQRLLVRTPSRAPVLEGATVSATSYADGELARRGGRAPIDLATHLASTPEREQNP